MRETAYAKINLALHVRARREDGYHELETLFAFVDAGDELVARPASEDRITTLGPFASGLEEPSANLVARALAMLPHSQGLNITLEKNLPIAAGLGGGSADAGAVFRIVEKLHGLPEDWPKRATKLGADVPSCVRSELAIGRGTGTELEPVENDMAGMPVLLVNPREPLATGPVFKAWQGRDGGPLEGRTAREIAECNRNDLEEVVIETMGNEKVLAVHNALTDTKPLIARMSGSGATCFALYETLAARDEASRRLTDERPDWWLFSGTLR